MNSVQKAEVVKGFSNHYRIEILRLLHKHPRLSVEEIADEIGAEYKTMAAHIRRMYTSGLVLKRYRGRRVEHILTKRGLNVLTFLRKLA